MAEESEHGHTSREIRSAHTVTSVRIGRAQLASVAELFSAIAEESRLSAMRAVRAEKKRLSGELGNNASEHLEMMEDIANHSLLPNFEISGDTKTVLVHSHAPDVFTNGSVLPQIIEAVTMEFGVGDTESAEFVGHIESTSMPYLRELRAAGRFVLRLGDVPSRGGALFVFASSEDETWAVGVVERIRKATEHYTTKHSVLYSSWLRYLVQTTGLAIFLSGVSLLIGRFFRQTTTKSYLDHPAPIIILAVAAVLGWALSSQVLKYLRWLFPLTEIDPRPSNTKIRHRRAIYWLVTAIVLPVIVGILVKYL